MIRRSPCDLLRPGLVARIYRESHPEAARLSRHLSVCAECRKEMESLLATRRCIDAALESLGSAGISPERTSGAWLPAARLAANLATAIAVLAMVALLLFDGGTGAPARGSRPTRDGELTTGSPSYDGAEIDGRLARARARLSALEDTTW